MGAKILRADALLLPAGEMGECELEIAADGLIAYVGPPRPGSRPTHNLPGHALLPGLVNAHTHSAMTLQRGISDDAGFMPWLQAVQSFEQLLDHDDIALGVQVAMLEMIATGTTTFADMYYWDQSLLEMVRAAGMRVLAAPAMFSSDSVAWPLAGGVSGAETLRETERLAQIFAHDAQIKLAFGPHAPYTTPPETLREIAARAVRAELPIHIHLAESLAEAAEISARFNSTPVAHLAALEFFSAKVLAAHCVHLSDSDLEILAHNRVAISHNPVSNLKLGCGVARVPDMLAAKIPLGLGTDSVASNNTLDMFGEIKLAAILHRGVRNDAAAIGARDAVDAATWRGAQAVGFADCGELVAGKQGDVVAISLDRVHASPRGSLLSHVAYAASGSDVRHVFIGGREVYAAGKHLTLNAGEIIAKAKRARSRLSVAAGLAAA